MKDYFPDFIGQDRARKALGFYLDSQRSTGILDPIFLSAPRGSGKTHLAKGIGKNLLNSNGKAKKFLEVNGASIKSLGSFVESIIVPHVANDQETTLFIDELPCADENTLDWLLSVLAPNDKAVTTARYRDMEFSFDFRKFSFISASTNPEKLSEPMKSRLTRIELDPYTRADLTKILIRNSEGTEFKNGIESEITNVVRGNPRLTVKRAKDVVKYVKTGKSTSFGKKEWLDLRGLLGIRPLGLNSNEVQVLQYLKEHGPSTLTSIAAKLGLDVTTIRRDSELFLLQNNLIVIDGKRCITAAGQKILAECEKEN